MGSLRACWFYFLCQSTNLFTLPTMFSSMGVVITYKRYHIMKLIHIGGNVHYLKDLQPRRLLALVARHV